MKSNIIESIKTQRYSTLKPTIYKQLNSFKPITSTKTKPTDKEYSKGNYTRYFCSRNNNLNSYVEIDKDIYKSIIAENNEYNYNLYTVGKIKWSLGGDVYKANTNSLIQTSREFPHIHLLFPKLNEFSKK